MSEIKSFEDLIAWQKAHELAVKVYGFVASFPDSEKFALSSQMRRAAISVASNIAEGFCRRGTKAKLQFYGTANGSLSELRAQLHIAKDVKVLSADDFTQSYLLADEVGKLINGLRRHIKQSASR